MVERAAHDGFVVGSNPTKPILFKNTGLYLRLLCTHKMYGL